MGGGGSDTTTQKTEPWEGVQPFLTGTQTTTRQLREGVQPIYGEATPGTGGAPLSGMSAFEQARVMQGLSPEQRQQVRDTGLAPGIPGTPGQLINPEADYIDVTTGTPGIYPEAARLYQKGQWSPEMQSILDQQMQTLQGRQADPIYGEAISGAQDIMRGRYDPDIQRVGPIAGVGGIAAQQISAGMVDPTQARTAMGALDPTAAQQRLLSGQVDNPQLAAMQQAAVNRAMTGYQDAVTRATQGLSREALPAIRSGALGAGQFGGTRQGIAEGIAMGDVGAQLARSARDLGLGAMDVGTQLYGGAYESAQQRMAGAAGQLGQQALDVATGNMARDLQAQGMNADEAFRVAQANAANQMAQQQFNANLGLQGNVQEMARAQQLLGTRQAGMGMLGQAQAMQDLPLQQQLALLQQPGQFDINQLRNYASIIQPGAGIGGTTTATAPGQGGGFSSALGGAMAGAQLGSIVPGIGTGLGAVGGGLMGFFG